MAIRGSALAAAIGLAVVLAGCGAGSMATGGPTSTGSTDTGVYPPELPAVAPPHCAEVEYGGEGEPEVLIASDLPLQGSQRTRTLQVVEGIRTVLAAAGWKAGDVAVGYLSCDDSTAEVAKWHPDMCAQNGHAYADMEELVAVIGPFDSGCAEILIPVLNQAGGGGLALVSPTNRDPCLTEPGPGCKGHEPDSYYPGGMRNYLRVVGHDAYQGVAIAQFMQDQATTKLFVLNDGIYGAGISRYVLEAAQHLGIEVVGFESWDPKAADYESLMTRIGESGADGVFLGGIIDQNGARVIADKVRVLGPNDGVKLFLSDGFTTQQTIDEAGVEATRDAFFAAPGAPLEAFTGTAAELIARWQANLGTDVDPLALHGAQAAQVVLDAIARSDGSRQDVILQLFSTEVVDGLLGDFTFDENGDPAGASGPVVATTILRGPDLLTETVVYAAPGLVASVSG